MVFEIDNLTVLLLVVLVGLSLYHRFHGPSPMVHPLLLGRQAEVSPVRQSGESGIYRSWATGQGTPLQVRPTGQLKTVGDAVRVPPPTPLPGKPVPAVSQRWILDTPLTNEALTEVVRLVPLGINALFPDLEGSVLTLLPPAPTAALPLLLLSLSSRPKHPLVILPHPRLLTTALKSGDHPAPGLLVVHESVLETLSIDLVKSTSILVVGDPERQQQNFSERAAKAGIAVRWWEEIWEEGEVADDIVDETLYSDTHSYFYAEDGSVVKTTHLNMTAGIAGLLSLFPADKRPTSADVIGSSVRLDTPFGMTIALAAVFTGAGFRFIGPGAPAWDLPSIPAGELGLLATAANQPMPSILFIAPAYHSVIISRLHDAFLASPLASVAARHRLQSIQAGQVSRGGLMDKLVWGSIRNTALGGIAGDALRAVIVVGAPSQTDVALSHALLSLPLTRLHTSFVSAGPVFVSHFYDLQGPPVDMFRRKLDNDTAHSGPPASNVEVILRGPKTELADNDDPAKPLEGRLWIRGPGVVEPIGVKSKDSFVNTADDAAVLTNGCFIIGA